MSSFEPHTPVAKESKNSSQHSLMRMMVNIREMRLMVHNKEEEQEGWNSGDPGILPFECLAQWKVIFTLKGESYQCVVTLRNKGCITR